MEYQEIFETVAVICREVFEDEKLQLSDETSAKDIRKWDSLYHVMLITAVEKKFGIRFDLDDMLDMRTIGQICSAVKAKI